MQTERIVHALTGDRVPPSPPSDEPRGLVRLEVPSDVQMVAVVEAVCDQLSRAHALTLEMAGDLALALREAVTNAIVHGNRQQTQRRVTIELRMEPGPRRTVVTVTDQGRGFDLEDVPDPCAGHNLVKPSGRGLLFMRALMDDVEVQRRPGGGCRILMVKRW